MGGVVHTGGVPQGGSSLSVLMHTLEAIMSRKDFVAIAQAIRQNIANKIEREAVAQALLPALRAGNERFNSERFLRAAIGE